MKSVLCGCKVIFGFSDGSLECIVKDTVLEPDGRVYYKTTLDDGANCYISGEQVETITVVEEKPKLKKYDGGKLQ